MVECERCGNTDPKYFVLFNGQAQCRRCIGYQGSEGESLVYEGRVEETLNFDLSPTQKEVSSQILKDAFVSDVLVHAICGAGKTELVLETISAYLNQGLKVGIAVARRQVVLQLASRYQQIYPALKVTPVCEGHTQDLSGHLIISTTHQLFRYPHHFDLLILDEPDAFPFKHDVVLQGFARKACKGHTLYLTATPDHQLKQWVREKKIKQVTLFRRPHQIDLPVPRLRLLPYLGQTLAVKLWLHRQTNPVLIFVPTLKLGQQLKSLLKIPFVHARDPDLDDLVTHFKQGQIPQLICTSVLERGVTFENVQVVMMEANHPIYDEATLIQIAGRVGRSVNYPRGEVLFYASALTKEMVKCFNQIAIANQSV